MLGLGGSERNESEAAELLGGWGRLGSWLGLGLGRYSGFGGLGSS